MQIKSVRLRDSKFGQALVIEAFPKAGGYILGFKIDTQEKMNDILKEIINLHQVFSLNPIFGVNFVIEDEMSANKPVLQPRIEEDINIIEEEDNHNTIATYYIDGTNAESNINQEIIYESRIGLAIEAMQDGVTLEHLWRVI